jgi:putative Mg2+ transporter-C (MgtC) family protein
MILLPTALVAVGSSLLTMTALFGFTDVAGTAPMQGDPTRIVSWIIVGSGLLGAGSLLGQRERPTVTGLTTAVLIWMVAVMGILCGAGWLIEAVGGTLLTLSIGLLYRLAKRYFSSH